MWSQLKDTGTVLLLQLGLHNDILQDSVHPFTVMRTKNKNSGSVAVFVSWATGWVWKLRHTVCLFCLFALFNLSSLERTALYEEVDCRKFPYLAAVEEETCVVVQGPLDRSILPYPSKYPSIKSALVKEEKEEESVDLFTFVFCRAAFVVL